MADQKTAEKNEKGDYAPEQRDLSSVLVLIKSLWALIVAYSLLVSQLTGGHWWEMIAHYIGFLACFYLWHWQAHVALSFIPFNKECRRLHSIHHWHIYPPHQFFGPTQGNFGKAAGIRPHSALMRHYFTF